MTAPNRAHTLAPLIPLPLLAGVTAWIFTTDWRWAAAGLLGVIAMACVTAALTNRKSTP